MLVCSAGLVCMSVVPNVLWKSQSVKWAAMTGEHTYEYSVFFCFVYLSVGRRDALLLRPGVKLTTLHLSNSAMIALMLWALPGIMSVHELL